jgi:hypothetical protein
MVLQALGDPCTQDRDSSVTADHHLHPDQQAKLLSADIRGSMYPIASFCCSVSSFGSQTGLEKGRDNKLHREGSLSFFLQLLLLVVAALALCRNVDATLRCWIMVKFAMNIFQISGGAITLSCVLSCKHGVTKPTFLV